MIKVGFIPPSTKDWMGGVNYFKNLLYAISKDKEIEPIIFIGKKADSDIKKIYGEFSQIIEHSIFDNKSIAWLLNKIARNYFLERLLIKHGVKVLSHTDIVNLKYCRLISWIPDLQHVQLPEMFSNKDVRRRNKAFHKIAKESDIVILSSYSALKDFKSFAPKYVDKVAVIQFVSQPDLKIFSVSQDDEESIKKKYGIKGDFFYLPNQFWKHKNHIIAFEAVNHLKKKGYDITLVCSGLMTDYRNEGHISNLMEYVKKNNLQDNILLLGLIPYSDVFSLMKASKAVINPSLFEGWSSTVEECKSVNKEMILSDLDVHKEQYPSARFFKKMDSIDLAEKMEFFENDNKSDRQLDGDSNLSNLEKRTQEFADKYRQIVVTLMTP